MSFTHFANGFFNRVADSNVSKTHNSSLITPNFLNYSHHTLVYLCIVH